MPSAAEVKALMRVFLREGRKFPNYNIRQYVRRRTIDGFREHAAAQGVQEIAALWKAAKDELEVVRRQAILYSLYARKQKSVMDIPFEEVLEKQAAATTAT